MNTEPEITEPGDLPSPDDPALGGSLDGKGILTFTANRRASLLAMTTALLFTVTCAIFYGHFFPHVPLLSWWWALLPLLPCLYLLTQAWDASRHPYLLLDGEGMIQRPFSEDALKTAWAHIDEIECRGSTLVLKTLNPLARGDDRHVEKLVEIGPLQPMQRDLLVRAIESQIVFGEDDEEEDSTL